MKDISRSGVFAALWELSEKLQCGFYADLKKIPIRQECIEICEYFDLNPYHLYGQGAILALVPSGGLERGAEKKEKTAGKTAAENAIENAAEDAAESSAEDAAESPVEDEAENVAENAAESSAEDAAENAAERAAENKVETGGEIRAEKAEVKRGRNPEAFQGEDTGRGLSGRDALLCSLAARGIAASRIGTITAGRARIIGNGEITRFLERPGQDALHSLAERRRMDGLTAAPYTI